MRLRTVISRLVGAAILASAASASGRAELVISIDKSAQQMTVTHDGALLFTWPVSTGRFGYDTPSGSFRPSSMEKEHFSKEWDDAPMPNSIFFTPEGHAIHGTLETRRLGTAVSHGCIRLSRKNAAALYDLVAAEGLESTEIVVTGADLGRLPGFHDGQPGFVVGVELGPTWNRFFEPIAVEPGP
jgi:lipoprotein-anchoring transpeptidase ErfK/SrfK